MKRILKIEGMHCEACKSLIKLELEENGFDEKVTQIELSGDNKGYVELYIDSEKEVKDAINIINNLQNYKVII